MPLSDTSTLGAAVSDPEVRSPVWFGLVDHLAPVKELGFTVVAADGTLFTPDGPSENAGNADVAQILRLTPLADRTRVDQLTFQTAGTLIEDPSTGNLRSGPGMPFEVPVRLIASTDPRIRDAAGADDAEIVLIGRWGTLAAPTGRPAGVGWGRTSPLVLDGQPGTLTIKLAYPDSDLWREVQFGARFLAVWTSR